jgi:hypothetical protein
MNEVWPSANQKTILAALKIEMARRILRISILDVALSRRRQ